MISKQNKIASGITLGIVSGAFMMAALVPVASAQSTEATAAPAASTADDASIAKVTITAQNRSQQLQEVPIALQVIKSDQITKLAANNMAELNGYIPGLSVDNQQPTQPNYTIRGIGSGDTFVGTDAPVGIYVDGVYTGKTGGALMNFNDVERVEVLKGPQGTLFGRNSAAGAISVITKEPSNEFENDYNARLGQYGERYIDTMLNVPLNDDFAARFSFVDHKSNGWLSDASTDAHLNDQGDWGTRATLRWNAPGRTKVIVSWEHESLNEQARPEIGLIPLSMQTPAVPFPANPANYLNPLTAPAFNNLNADNNVERRLFNGVTLRIDHPMDWATFDSTTAYRHFNSVNITNNTGATTTNAYLDTGNVEKNSTIQQEFRFSGKNELVDWLAGASLFHETADQQSQVITNTDTLDTIINNTQGIPLYTSINQLANAFGIPVNMFGNGWQENMNNVMTSKSYAFYTDAIWHVTDKLNFTTGVRFSHDSKDFSWYNPPRSAPGLDTALSTLNQNNFFPTAVAAGYLTPQLAAMAQGAMTTNIEYYNPLSTSAPFAMSKSWSDTSPRGVLDYKITPDLMVFGSVTKGYQSGGFNAQSVAAQYSPEQVRNYELGIKSYFPDQHLLINASLFYYKFTNLQSLTLVQNGNAIPQYQITTSDQVAKGLDLDTQWKASRNLRLFAVGEYIDQKYGTYTDANGVNLDNQPSGLPLWSAAAGIDYTQRDVFGGSLNYSLQHAYTAPKRCNADAPAQGNCLVTPTFTIDGSTERTDGRIGWDNGDHRFGVALYVQNLLNNRYVTGIDNTTLTVLGTPGAQISAPRIVGVQLHWSL